MKPINRITLYRTEECYVAPIGSLAICPNGDFIASFREADRRRAWSHIDPGSRAVLVRSHDGGEIWGDRSVIYDGMQAVQDPNVASLSDSSIICTFFAWGVGSSDEIPADAPPGRLTRKGWDSIHSAWTIGTFAMKSTDSGHTWSAPAPVDSPLGKATLTSDPVIELPGGELLIPLYGKRSARETDLAAVSRSTNHGAHWDGFAVAAFDPLLNVQFCEPSIVRLPSGKLICMSRGHYLVDPGKGADSGTPMYLYQSESHDSGITWGNLHRTEIWGHPAHLTLLADGRLLCAYGYRRPPYGVHACLSHDEGESWDLEHELVLYSGGKGFDLGYPASVQRSDGAILTAWYESSQPGVSELQGVLYTV